MSKIRAWFWWWFGLDTVTRNYIRHEQPNKSLLMRHLTREETLYIPWHALDKIELPRIITKSEADKAYCWFLRREYREQEFYLAKLDYQYMYRLYLLRNKEMQEAHDAWFASFKRLKETLSKPIM